MMHAAPYTKLFSVVYRNNDMTPNDIRPIYALHELFTELVVSVRHVLHSPLSGCHESH